ncbi:MAG: hypothetical protein AAF213_12520 [Pseudomonadota bacterium]
MFAGQLKPDTLESVTLEAIGAVSATSVHVFPRARAQDGSPYVHAGDLAERIGGALKAAGPATDQASRDMTKFLGQVTPHLKMLDQLSPMTDLWAGYYTTMLPKTNGPARALFDKYFKDAAVPADHRAAHIPAKMQDAQPTRRAH